MFIVGEFGGNGYNAPIFSGSPGLAEIKTWVPQIVDRIASGVETLIGLGATEVVVPGVLPIGCFPLYLTLYPSSNKDDYDEIGCLNELQQHDQLHVCVCAGLKYGLKVCCGADGQGSYNNHKRCGDPENYLVWDGIHLTDAAYRAIADGWLNGTYCSPGILH